jgi:hypothetical protein
VVEGVFGLGYPLDYLAIVVVCMSYATIDELRSQLGGAPKHSPEYLARMMHPLPSGACVDRAKFILERVTGKRVLEFGASGPMHEKIVNAAGDYAGIDRKDSKGSIERDGKTLYYRILGFDLDDVRVPTLPSWWIPDDVAPEIMITTQQPEVIVCGEVLEHLGNPQFFLKRLREQFSGIPVIITVPNAYTTVGRKYLAEGLENVNIDHCSWHSPRTLKTLVERVGYVIKEFAYYNGDGPTAEGLIAVVE